MLVLCKLLPTCLLVSLIIFVEGTLPVSITHAETPSQAKNKTQPGINSDFASGDFAHLGWKVQGNWDIYSFANTIKNNPGSVARFPANKGKTGSLTKTFPEIDSFNTISLSLDYGWGWGDANQGADAIYFELLDRMNNGLIFEVHRCKATWAVQWGVVREGVPAKDKTWAKEDIDATHPSIRDGGGMCRVLVQRQADGIWTIACPQWNKGVGGTVKFTEPERFAFNQVVLLGTNNFDDQVYNKVTLLYQSANQPVKVQAIPAVNFLNSLGINTTFPDRGQPLAKTIDMINYCGFRWVRGGIEGLSAKGPTTIQTYLDLHDKTGVKFSWGLVSGGTDLKKLLDSATEIAKANALLAFEGNNEPNNWGVTYQGVAGGGRAPSWMAVAQLQRDLYKSVKGHPVLKSYPVWSISENGAEVDNVGLQFLTIPTGTKTLLPAGTHFADFANVHNYIYHPGSPGLADNKTWNAADPSSLCRVDGLYGNYGRTWAKHFPGYSESDLESLPRVTTETGCTVDGKVTEEIQALNLLSLYLDQFKRGWAHTAVYLLRDRTDEGGNQSFGFFDRDYKPRKAALYLHNLTTILQDRNGPLPRKQFEYGLSAMSATMHEMLLQKSDNTFALLVWNEKLKGEEELTVHFAQAPATVKVYDPTRGIEPLESYKSCGKLKLTLSDHPRILLISP